MSFGPEYSETGATIYFGAISGTHSAGKTTLLNDLLDCTEPVESIPDITNGVSFPKFRVLNGVTVAFVPEATTEYMRINEMPTLATTDYTREHQIGMEEFSLSMISTARSELSRILEDTETTTGLILTDRTPLDGIVYRSLRVPNDNAWVDHFENDTILYGRAFNKVKGVKTHNERMWKSFLRRYCDFVVFPDHRELPLEDNGTRLPDIKFRDDVAQKMRNAYINAVREHRVHDIAGDRNQRIKKILEIIDTTIAT